MNETNRIVIVILAALWVILMAVVIFAAWAADAETVERLDDFVQYLGDHRDNASRLILTLGALVLVVLALLVIIVEVAPEEETREIRLEQAGATTIVPAEPLRLRLEEVLTSMPQVTAARVRVFSRNKGIGMKLDLTVTPGANVAAVTQEASRLVADTLQADLGLPVSAPPAVRVTFGSPKVEPVASSVTRPPAPAAPPTPTGPQTPPPGGPVAPAAGAPPSPTVDEGTPYVAPGPAAETKEPAQPRPPSPGPEAPPTGESASEDQTQQH